MRFERARRLLGPLEPSLHRAWEVGAEQVARVRRRGLVVLAVDADHADRVEELGARLGPGTVGVWVCCRTDVADLGTAGWFVVRFDPASLADRDRRRGALDAVVATWRGACRRVEVVDLDAS